MFPPLGRAFPLAGQTQSLPLSSAEPLLSSELLPLTLIVIAITLHLVILTRALVAVAPLFTLAPVPRTAVLALSPRTSDPHCCLGSPPSHQ